MSFRLWTIFYVVAVVAAALATFGPPGIFLGATVLALWALVFHAPKPQISFTELTVVALILGILVALMLPAVQSSHQVGPRSSCGNNLKQIAQALLTYESAKGTFPPPLADTNGNLHSWRVLILPYLDEQSLYQKYNFNEPWDGPNNSKFAAEIPRAFQCPSQFDERNRLSTETHYFAVVAPETVFPKNGPGRTLRAISDGTSKTIMVIEASGLGVNWMEPRDPTIDEAIELMTTKPGHTRVSEGFLTTTYYETWGRNAAFCDGHVAWVGPLNDAEIVRALLTAAGGEPIPQKLKERYVEPRTTTVVKWGKVWGLCLFVVLPLLPAVRLRRR